MLSLCNDILIYILSFLDIDDLNNLKLVNKHFYSLVNCDYLWYLKLRSDFNDCHILPNLTNKENYLLNYSDNGLYYGIEKYKSLDICIDKCLRQEKLNINLLYYFVNKVKKTKKITKLNKTSLSLGLIDNMNIMKEMINIGVINLDILLHSLIINSRQDCVNMVLNNLKSNTELPISTYFSYFMNDENKEKIMSCNRTLDRDISLAIRACLESKNYYEFEHLYIYCLQHELEINYQDIVVICAYNMYDPFENEDYPNLNTLIFSHMNEHDQYLINYYDMIIYSISRSDYKTYNYYETRITELGHDIEEFFLNHKHLLIIVLCSCLDLSLLYKICKDKPDWLLEINCINGNTKEVVNCLKQIDNLDKNYYSKVAKDHHNYNISMIIDSWNQNIY